MGNLENKMKILAISRRPITQVVGSEEFAGWEVLRISALPNVPQIASFIGVRNIGYYVAGYAESSIGKAI